MDTDMAIMMRTKWHYYLRITNQYEFTKIEVFVIRIFVQNSLFVDDEKTNENFNR